MSWIQYSLLTNIYLVVFLGFYFLFLKKQTFFQLNRLYLLASLALSFIMPLIQPTWLGGLGVTRDIKYTIDLPAVTIAGNTHASAEYLTADQIVAWIYFAGIALGLGGLIYRLTGVRRFMTEGNASMSYSFFRKIHIGNNHFGNGQISEHERIHAAQWHTADILFAEMVLIFNWFNPTVYFFRKELKNVHEFIADEGALKSGSSKQEYAMLLISQTFEVPINNLVNTFFNQNLLKQRIMMIQKNRTGKSALVRYALLIPVLSMMLILSSATMGTSAGPKSPSQHSGKVYTQVDQVPTFPGGQQKFGEFLGKNIKYPADMKAKHAEAKVFVSFIVEEDGALTNIKAVSKTADSFNKAAINAMSLSPKWNPGVEKGKKVRVQFVVPINFVLPKS